MKKITEGMAKLVVPEQSLTRKSEAFYNREMEHQRNVTVACVRLLEKKDALDPLAATGVRGIRLMKEAHVERVVFNDINPAALKLLRKNLALNRLKKGSYAIKNEDASRVFLEKEKYGYVDIDPFGSPVRFLRNAGYALGHHSALGVTATDTGALAGKFADACFRRYGVFVCDTDFPKELGIRVLATSIIQNLAAHGLAFEPLYCHANHYFRIIGSVHYGSDKGLQNIRMVSYCPRCHNKIIGLEKSCDNCKSGMNIIGPLWTGKILDTGFCGGLLSNFEFRDGRKEIMLCVQEIDQPFYYDLHELGRFMKRGTPRIEMLIESLRENGFRASRTHLCSTGIKTDARISDLRGFFEKS